MENLEGISVSTKTIEHVLVAVHKGHTSISGAKLFYQASKFVFDVPPLLNNGSQGEIHTDGTNTVGYGFPVDEMRFIDKGRLGGIVVDRRTYLL
jgi:hypothetical protein